MGAPLASGLDLDSRVGLISAPRRSPAIEAHNPSGLCRAHLFPVDWPWQDLLRHLRSPQQLGPTSFPRSLLASAASEKGRTSGKRGSFTHSPARQPCSIRSARMERSSEKARRALHLDATVEAARTVKECYFRQQLALHEPPWSSGKVYGFGVLVW